MQEIAHELVFSFSMQTSMSVHEAQTTAVTKPIALTLSVAFFAPVWMAMREMESTAPVSICCSHFSRCDEV